MSPRAADNDCVICCIQWEDTGMKLSSPAHVPSAGLRAQPSNSYYRAQGIALARNRVGEGFDPHCGRPTLGGESEVRYISRKQGLRQRKRTKSRSFDSAEIRFAQDDRSFLGYERWRPPLGDHGGWDGQGTGPLIGHDVHLFLGHVFGGQLPIEDSGNT
jgi:hypothetical protein